MLPSAIVYKGFKRNLIQFQTEYNGHNVWWVGYGQHEDIDCMAAFDEALDVARDTVYHMLVEHKIIRG